MAINAVTVSCVSLTSLIVVGCSNLMITDEAIKATTASCAPLTSLDASFCPICTNETIKAVTAGCAALTWLNVGGYPNLALEFLRTLRQNITWLQLRVYCDFLL